MWRRRRRAKCHICSLEPRFYTPPLWSRTYTPPLASGGVPTCARNATMCCTLTPDLVGVSSGRGPNRAYPNLLLLIWTFSFLDGGVTKTQYFPSNNVLLYSGVVMRGHKTDFHIHTISLLYVEYYVSKSCYFIRHHHPFQPMAFNHLIPSCDDRAMVTSRYILSLGTSPPRGIKKMMSHHF